MALENFAVVAYGENGLDGPIPGDTQVGAEGGGFAEHPLNFRIPASVDHPPHRQDPITNQQNTHSRCDYQSHRFILMPSPQRQCLSSCQGKGGSIEHRD
ncbi:MAG: hypothetical protein V3S64_08095, partial [bacterium]